MKCTVQLFRLMLIVMCGAGCMLSCKKNGTTEDPPSAGNGDSTSADTISNHLKLINASKKTGSIPAGSATSSLKISFKDTLYLQDAVMLPVKFLHTDTTKNVTGIYLQVRGFVGSAGGSFASYYYDIPEVPEAATNDSVSVMMVGIDPAGLTTPLTFEVTIVPYDKNKQPIARATRPVKIVKQVIDANGTAGSCGLALPSGEHWDWEASYILAKTPTATHSLDFYNDPDKQFGAEGQLINGSCCNGISIYGICPGLTLPNRKLHFPTYYQIIFEQLSFFGNGTYFRQTLEDAPFPLPDQSDFCQGIEGVVKPNLNHTTYNGNWALRPVKLPADLPFKDSVAVGFLTSTQSPLGSGFGNPGGVIHILDCNNGWLVLIQIDLEGNGQHLYKFYRRRALGAPTRWYNFA